MEKNEKYYEKYTYTADPKQTLVRIDKFLMDRIEHITRNRIQNAIKDGLILVNNEFVKSNYKVKPHDIITVTMEKTIGHGEIIPEELEIDIRYEDDDILVLYKPAGLVVHPGVGNRQGTLVNALAYYFKNLPKLGDNDDQLGLVHRIDKNTSGLMVVAKNDQAMAGLAKQFFDHTIHRRYNAIAWGDFDQDEGTIVGNIGRHPTQRRLRHVFEEGEAGKHAITHYKVLRRFGYITFLECRLETGRTHQIRVHMKYVGHPLFNDDLYGGDRIVKGTVFTKYKQFVENCFRILPRHALHARSLGFTHPITGEYMIFESDLPKDFLNILDKWERYTSGRTNQPGMEEEEQDKQAREAFEKL